MRTDGPQTWERAVSGDVSQGQRRLQVWTGKLEGWKCQEGGRTWHAGAYNLFDAIRAGE